MAPRQRVWTTYIIVSRGDPLLTMLTYNMFLITSQCDLPLPHYRGKFSYSEDILKYKSNDTYLNHIIILLSHFCAKKLIFVNLSKSPKIYSAQSWTCVKTFTCTNPTQRVYKFLKGHYYNYFKILGT